MLYDNYLRGRRCKKYGMLRTIIIQQMMEDYMMEGNADLRSMKVQNILVKIRHTSVSI